jgi:hypothetical protein
MYKIKSKDIDEGESANCVWVYVWILGWPYVFIESKKAIYKGTELVLDYNLESYWVAMERIIKDHQLISGLQNKVVNPPKEIVENKVKKRVTNGVEATVNNSTLMSMRKSVVGLAAKLWDIEAAPVDARWKEGEKKLGESIAMLDSFLGGAIVANGTSESSSELQAARKRMSTPIVIGMHAF